MTTIKMLLVEAYPQKKGKKKSGTDLENAYLMPFNILLTKTMSVNNLSAGHIKELTYGYRLLKSIRAKDGFRRAFYSIKVNILLILTTFFVYSKIKFLSVLMKI